MRAKEKAGSTLTLDDMRIANKIFRLIKDLDKKQSKMPPLEDVDYGWLKATFEILSPRMFGLNAPVIMDAICTLEE